MERAGRRWLRYDLCALGIYLADLEKIELNTAHKRARFDYAVGLLGKIVGKSATLSAVQSGMELRKIEGFSGHLGTF